MMLLFQNLITKFISVNYSETQKWQWSAKDISMDPKDFSCLMLMVVLGSARIFIPKPNNIKNEYTIGSECISFFSLLLFKY